MRACACARQLRDALDGVDLSGDPREHRRLVAGARSDFKHAARFVALQQLGHTRDDVGLRDGLVGVDGERVVAVGAALKRLGDEEVARHVGHRRQHAAVPYPVVVAQALDHALARDAEARRLRGREV